MALVLALFVVWLVGTKHYAAYAQLLTQQAATPTATGTSGGTVGSNPAIQPVAPASSNSEVSPFTSFLNSFYNNAMFSPEQNAYGFLPSTAAGGATAAQGGPLIVGGLV